MTVLFLLLGCALSSLLTAWATKKLFRTCTFWRLGPSKLSRFFFSVFLLGTMLTLTRVLGFELAFATRDFSGVVFYYDYGLVIWLQEQCHLNLGFASFFGLGAAAFALAFAIQFANVKEPAGSC